jgi:TetR/AcrR family transcriptional repressor of mexJK operon
MIEKAVNTAEPERKVDFILKAAQKRLGIYGYEKTTMQEIAADIALSKAALYYYYPDKESLFKAVIENEQKEFFLQIEHRIAELTDADSMIMELVELRHTLFRQFLNLSKFRLTDNHKVKPLLNDLYQRMRELETETLTSIFKKGKETGIFQFDDASELARLFSDLLQGIRIMEMKRMSRLEMTDEENDHLIKMLREATILFINGLKYNKLIEPVK